MTVLKLATNLGMLSPGAAPTIGPMLPQTGAGR